MTDIYIHIHIHSDYTNSLCKNNEVTENFKEATSPMMAFLKSEKNCCNVRIICKWNNRKKTENYIDDLDETPCFVYIFLTGVECTICIARSMIFTEM